MLIWLADLIGLLTSRWKNSFGEHLTFFTECLNHPQYFVGKEKFSSLKIDFFRVLTMLST